MKKFLDFSGGQSSQWFQRSLRQLLDKNGDGLKYIYRQELSEGLGL